MILDEIAERTRKRVEQRKAEIPLAEMRQRVQKAPVGNFSFENALKTESLSFICEVKKASPSKGLIVKDFSYVQIAKDYEAAGAAAVSVLTEPYFFQGADSFLTEIKENISIPVLRKDFTVDEYMIYEAKVIGADAVLLICSLLDTETIRTYLKIADGLGLSAIVEAHDQMEVGSALAAGARIIGVNNRNLKDFTVDIENSIRLRRLVPDGVIFVSESGIKTPQDIAALRENGTDAVLIGESLMVSRDKKAELDRLRGIPY